MFMDQLHETRLKYVVPRVERLFFPLARDDDVREKFLSDYEGCLLNVDFNTRHPAPRGLIPFWSS